MLNPSLMRSYQTGGLDEGVLLNILQFIRPHTTRFFLMGITKRQGLRYETCNSRWINSAPCWSEVIGAYKNSRKQRLKFRALAGSSPQAPHEREWGTRSEGRIPCYELSNAVFSSAITFGHISNIKFKQSTASTVRSATSSLYRHMCIVYLRYAFL